MIEQLKTIREARDLLNSANLLSEIKAAVLLDEALFQLEAMAGEPVAWIEHYQGSIAYNPYPSAARQLPDGVRFDLYTATPPAQQPQAEAVRWRPDVCPITGKPFFMWIDHPERGSVPTYGGPYDSYTIPVRDDAGSFCCERYDHDYGWWVDDEVHDVGVQIVSDQAYVSDEAPQQAEAVPSDDLHAFLDAAAGEGLILGGVDAADLYIKLFPERYSAAIAAQGEKP